MVAARPKLRFFLDQNVPDSICRYLRGRGHSVLLLRHHIPDDSPDPVVGMTALKARRILVTCDRDFNAQRFRQDRFAELSRISLCGPGPTLLSAIKEHIEVLEFQMPRFPAGGRMVAQIQTGIIRFRTN
ncbi:DUF5615 family PIN-like protein [Sphingopyxis kveilinensis]|uniref:DUF5615 family PIN-like protein n=1 Tax=Sphingopyxis kveilinensis TaxID=3114367 RepID=UPI0030D60188